MNELGQRTARSHLEALLEPGPDGIADGLPGLPLPRIVGIEFLPTADHGLRFPVEWGGRRYTLGAVTALDGTGVDGTLFDEHGRRILGDMGGLLPEFTPDDLPC